MELALQGETDYFYPNSANGSTSTNTNVTLVCEVHSEYYIPALQVL